MTAVISLLLILAGSVLLTRIGTVILAHTGLSKEMARFQARSAFTGAGFTTSESEKIVNHPVRRRVVSLLIMLGNAGVVTAIASLILAFAGPESSGVPSWLSVVLIAAGSTAVWMLAKSTWFDRLLSRVVRRLLDRSDRVNVVDIDSLLHLAEGYRITELPIDDQDHWLADKTMQESALRDEGVTVLAITREDGTFIGTVGPHTRVEAGDTLVCFGQAETLDEMEGRRRGRSGEHQHDRHVAEQDERQRDAQRREARRRLAKGREERAERQEQEREAGSDAQSPTRGEHAA